MESLHDLLLDSFGDTFLEEYEEVEFLINEEEPRPLAQILEAEQEFFDRVKYVRDVVHFDEDGPEMADDLRAMVRAARQRVEDKYPTTRTEASPGGPNCAGRNEVCSGVGLRASPCSWAHPSSRRRS